MIPDEMTVLAKNTAPRARSFGRETESVRIRLRLTWIALALPPLLALGGIGQAWAEKRLFRWVDQDGNVHYSDVIPPSQSTQGHDELSKEGITRKTVEPPKSREEYLREKELERLRSEQQKLIEQQQASDRVLLATYRTEDEILLTREGKIASVDAAITVILSNVQRQKRVLTDLQSEAAGHERRGQKIPKNLQGRIDEAEKAIAAAYESIVRREQQKDSVRAEFESNLTRFRDLKQLTAKSVSNKRALSSTPAQAFADLENVVICEGAASCNDLWGRAKTFVAQNATTPLQLFGPNIHMTALPAGDQDISITLSLIPNTEDPGSVIFMDLQCSRSPVGQQFCESPGVAKIRKGFKGFVRQAK